MPGEAFINGVPSRGLELVVAFEPIDNVEPPRGRVLNVEFFGDRDSKFATPVRGVRSEGTGDGSGGKGCDSRFGSR